MPAICGRYWIPPKTKDGEGKMTKEKNYEFVSAAMDGELSDREFECLLKDGDMQKKWYEYHLIRDCIQYKQQTVGKDIEFTADGAFLARLAAVTEERKAACRAADMQVSGSEGAAAEVSSNHSFRWFSIAASVAAAAVIVWQMSATNPEAGSAVSAQETRKAQPADSGVVPVSAESPANNANSADVVVPNAAIEDQNKVEIKSAVQIEKQVLNSDKQPGNNKTVVQ